MEPVKEIAGTASAIVGCVPMACGALSGFWITRHDAADGRRVGVFVAVTATLALVTALLVRRGRAR
jgi:hypothetical protein